MLVHYKYLIILLHIVLSRACGVFVRLLSSSSLLEAARPSCETHVCLHVEGGAEGRQRAAV